VRILLTGKNGQLGWELQRALAPLAELIACDRSELDLGTPDRITSVLRATSPDVIVNAAAYTEVDNAEVETEHALAINARAPGIMAEEAKRLGALLVHYSTDYVFDGTKPAPYVEDDPAAPLNVYGASKLAGEQAVRQVGAHYVILRTSWVYAARGRNFLLTLRRLLNTRDEVRVVSDQVGAPTSAAALANATAAVLRRGPAALRGAPGVYHATTAGETSWYGFAAEIARLENSRVRLVPITSAEYAAPARRPANSRLSSAKLHGTFGVRLPDWRQALEACHAELLALERGRGSG
jgi:dTDP-4-dehydrorhamnose reductase